MHRLSFRKSMCRNNKKKKATVRAYQVKKHPYLPFLFSGLASTFRFYRLPRFPARLASESDFLIFFFFSFPSFLFFFCIYECRAQKPCERLPFTFENAYKQSSLTEKKKNESQQQQKNKTKRN